MSKLHAINCSVLLRQSESQINIFRKRNTTPFLQVAPRYKPLHTPSPEVSHSCLTPPLLHTPKEVNSDDDIEETGTQKKILSSSGQFVFEIEPYIIASVGERIVCWILQVGTS